MTLGRCSPFGEGACERCFRPKSQGRKAGGFSPSIPAPRTFFSQIRATPLARAASATALATAGHTRSSKAAGRIYPALS